MLTDASVELFKIKTWPSNNLTFYALTLDVTYAEKQSIHIGSFYVKKATDLLLCQYRLKCFLQLKLNQFFVLN